MKLERLREILARAAGKRIAVAGDLMLDEFVWGKVGRISPEAPVPVVEVTGESLLSRRRGQRRAQSARIHRPASRSSARSGPTQRAATARSPARAKDRHRSRARGSGFPHDREDAHHCAAPAGGAGRSRRNSPALRAAGRGDHRRSARDSAEARCIYLRRLRQRFSQRRSRQANFRRSEAAGKIATADPNPASPGRLGKHHGGQTQPQRSLARRRFSGDRSDRSADGRRGALEAGATARDLGHRRCS